MFYKHPRFLSCTQSGGKTHPTTNTTPCVYLWWWAPRGYILNKPGHSREGRKKKSSEGKNDRERDLVCPVLTPMNYSDPDNIIANLADTHEQTHTDRNANTAFVEVLTFHVSWNKSLGGSYEINPSGKNLNEH